MVCSTSQNINKDTNTNIKSVCTYSEHGQIDYNQCKKICNI